MTSTPSDGFNQSQSSLDQKLEAEIEAALGNMSLEDMLDDEAPSHSTQPTVDRPASTEGRSQRPARRPQSSGAPGGTANRSRSSKRRGDAQRARREPEPALPTRTGRVAALHGGNALVEFDPKTHGMCPAEQFEEPPAIGAEMEFILEKYDENERMYLLGRRGTVRKAEWESLEVGQVIEARCTGTNKGGLEMEVANHPAFMPAGQVDLRHIDQLDVFIGEKMPCEVIEIDRQRARIILSRRSHLQTERVALREKLLEELEVGQTRTAMITTVKPYGAFADLGGVDGLIHVSDISHDRIKDPNQVVKVGDQVQVQILKIEGQNDDLRISLGMKQLQDDPFEAGLQEVEEGATVTGRITKLMNFGAFVEISPGVEGLIHISELSHDRINRVSQVVKPDQVVSVKVLSIDPQSRRISLSIKALEDRKDAMGNDLQRNEDPHMRKLKAMLGAKFGDGLKGGLG